MKTKGFSIVELIVGIALFAIVASGAVVSILGSFRSVLAGEAQSQASFVALQSFEAVKSIKIQNWSALVNGPHGLIQTAGVWSFSGTSDSSGGFIRVVTIADVFRLNGAIVTSGGTLDPETKKITITVSWLSMSVISNSIVFETYVTKWRSGKTPGTIAPSCATQAECLDINSAGAILTNVGKRLEGILLGNFDTANAITISKMRVSWTGGTPGNTLSVIRINGSNVWNGTAASGVQVVITPVVLPASAVNIPLNYLGFTLDMTGGTVSVEFTMSDASVITESGIGPL